MLKSNTVRYYNEMGSGYDEFVIVNDTDRINNSIIIHVGTFHDVATPSTVDTYHMNERGLTNLEKPKKNAPWWKKLLRKVF